MNHRIRLGPMAVFLAIVSVVMATLAVLATATSKADNVLAERFAGVTAERYAVAADGEKLMAEFDSQAKAGHIDAKGLGLTKEGDVYRTQIGDQGYALVIALSEPDANGNYTIKEWKITRQWDAADPSKDVWKGEGL